jgi:protocatechuate 3,4-dioxygenase beta subunit
MDRRIPVVVLAGLGLVVAGAWLLPALTSGRAPDPGVATPTGDAESDPSPDRAQSRSSLDAPTSRAAVEEPGASRPATRTSDASGDLLVRVTWSDGSPAASIHLFVAGGQAWPQRPLARLRSDAHGEARARALPAGKVRLSSDRAVNKEVEILAGQEQEVRLVLPAGVDVEGIVRDGGREPVPGADIWLTVWAAPWQGGAIVARSGPDGTFRVRSVPPQQSLGALADGFAPSELVDLELLDCRNPPVRVELVVGAAGGALAGRVLDPRMTGIAGAMVAVGSPKYRGEPRTGRGQAEHWSPRPAITDADGRFRIASLAPGRHPVEVWAAGYPYWHGQCEIVANTTATLEVQLLDGVTVHGIVRDADGKGLAGAIVRAFPETIAESYLQFGQFDYDSAFGYAFAVADSAGRYRLEQAAPGAIHLYARSGADRRTEEVLPWAATVLDGAPGAVLEWSPTLDPGPTISGVVRYRDGVPMARVFVSAMESGTGKRQAVTTDKEGRFRFVRLQRRPYDLAVQFWSAPKDAPPLDRRDVRPDEGLVELIAAFDAPKKLASASVRGRVQDAARRLKQALGVTLSYGGGWYTNSQLDGDAFHFTGVEAGRRYQVLVMSGEDPVLASAWFELGPGEEKQLGTLVTEPGGTLRLRIERSPGTEKIAPSVYLQLEGSSRKVEPGTSAEVLIDNLSPGTWRLTAYAEGMASVRGECRVVVGVETEGKITLRAAAQREIVVEYAATQRLSRIQVRDATGVDHLDMQPRTTTLPRPYTIKLRLPLGHFTFSAETESGASGRMEFDMTSLAEGQPPVRLQVQ